MKLKRILKTHKIHIATRANKLYSCSEFCWRVLRTYTWLKCLWLPFVECAQGSHIFNTFNLGMKCTVCKKVMKDMINVIWEAKCILTCQLSSLSLFWASSKSCKPKKDFYDIFLWHLGLIKLLVFFVLLDKIAVLGFFLFLGAGFSSFLLLITPQGFNKN